MVFRYLQYFVIILLLGFVSLSCSSSIYHTKEHIVDNKYDSEFPDQNSSSELEKISSTIHRVSSIAFYKTYTFDSNSMITKSELTDELIKSKYIKSTVLDKPALGTGTLIYSNSGLLGLLTCAHIINFPDTILTYFAEPSGILSDYVQSISFKTKQNVYVAGFPGDSQVDIILQDNDLDIAFLGKKFDMSETAKYPVFNYKFGNAKELEWGSFVYLLGYPLNYKILSRAIVSSPNYDNHGAFLIDAPVNKGFSGGIVLAIRDGVPNFELVGIIQSVPEQSESVLEPSAIDSKFKYSTIVPYNGDMYVKQLKIMEYGIAKVISIEQIVNYLKKNKDILKSKGYYLNLFN